MFLRQSTQKCGHQKITLLTLVQAIPFSNTSHMLRLALRRSFVEMTVKETHLTSPAPLINGKEIVNIIVSQQTKQTLIGLRNFLST